MSPAPRTGQPEAPSDTALLQLNSVDHKTKDMKRRKGFVGESGDWQEGEGDEEGLGDKKNQNADL